MDRQDIPGQPLALSFPAEEHRNQACPVCGNHVDPDKSAYGTTNVCGESISLYADGTPRRPTCSMRWWAARRTGFPSDFACVKNARIA